MSELPTIFESPTTGAPRLVGEEFGDSHTALNTTLVGVEFLPYKTDEASVVTDFTDADDSDTMSCARSGVHHHASRIFSLHPSLSAELVYP